MTTLAAPPREHVTSLLQTGLNPNDRVVGPRPDAAVLQQLISETMWQLRKATQSRDALAARRAKRRMNELLDELADSVIGECASTSAPAVL
ncbi:MULTISPECIES: hypothetical protein [unclassified Mycobacterium]|uniref:hypothetical protein n=1 Tax=unclassified Mycobacterium TaxID=2642494 RepID=UPI0029C73593|nr:MULTISPECIES: hypothetical protein [unclassified Mycobacterium]